MTLTAPGTPSFSNSKPVLRQLRLQRRQHSENDGFAISCVAHRCASIRVSIGRAALWQGFGRMTIPHPTPAARYFPHGGTLLRPTKLFTAS